MQYGTQLSSTARQDNSGSYPDTMMKNLSCAPKSAAAPCALSGILVSYCEFTHAYITAMLGWSAYMRLSKPMKSMWLSMDLKLAKAALSEAASF